MENHNVNIEIDKITPIFFIIYLLLLAGEIIFFVSFATLDRGLWFEMLAVFCIIIGFFSANLFVFIKDRTSTSILTILPFLLIIATGWIITDLTSARFPSMRIDDIVTIYAILLFPTYVGVLIWFYNPYITVLRSIWVDDAYQFKIERNFLVTKKVKSYTIPKDSTIHLEFRSWEFGRNQTSKHILHINSNTINYQRIEFLTERIRSLTLLATLMKLFPEYIQMRTDTLQSENKGLIQYFEPKTKSVSVSSVRDFACESSDDMLYEIHYIQKSGISLERNYFTPLWKIFLIFIWGILISAVLLAGLVFFVLVSYIQLPDGNLVMVIIGIPLSLALFGVFYITFRYFVVWSLVFIIGSPKYTFDDDSLSLYYQFAGIRSLTYKIPLILNPKIRISNEIVYFEIFTKNKNIFSLSFAKVSHNSG